MGEAFQSRLDLLEDSGKISPQAKAATNHMMQAVESFLGEPVRDDHGIMMTTHLALACQRVLVGEPVRAPDPTLEAELLAYPRERDLADRLGRQIESLLGAPLPANEVIYLAVHLAARRKEGEL